MAQTLSMNLVHVIFSTKDRLPLIKDGPALHAYLAGVGRKLDCECFRVGGMADHVHLALRLASTITAAKLVSELKTGSSLWMKAQGVSGFAWQRGYGLFSVAPAHLDPLCRYIEGQEAHHTTRSFQDELRAICAKCHVALDERYVWG